MHGVGAAGFGAMLEEADKRLTVPDCVKCGTRTEILGYHGKTFTCRLGKVTIRRRRVQCRACGNGHYPLDRHLGIEGEGMTPGAASVIADAARDDSYEASSQKLRNTAGISLGSSFHRPLGKEERCLPAKA